MYTDTHVLNFDMKQKKRIGLKELKSIFISFHRSHHQYITFIPFFFFSHIIFFLMSHFILLYIIELNAYHACNYA